MLLYHLVDHEILDISNISKKFSNLEDLVAEVDYELKLIVLFMDIYETIVLPPTYFFESLVCRKIIEKNVCFIEQGYIRFLMDQASFEEFVERKKERYTNVMHHEKYEQAYYKGKYYGIKDLPAGFSPKTIEPGRIAFATWEKQVIAEAKANGMQVKKFRDLIKRIKANDSGAFTWESVKDQLDAFSKREINTILLRERSTSTYIDAHRKGGYSIIIGSDIVHPILTGTATGDFDLTPIKRFVALSGAESIIRSLTCEQIISIKAQFEIDEIRIKIFSQQPMTKQLSDAFVSLVQPLTRITTGVQMKEKIFVVHGHDEHVKEMVSRFLEVIGFEAIILHEQASGGGTIIEKLEKHTDVKFGVILYTPCDVGGVKEDPATLNARARQNVVFEHGYLIGKLGRNNVCALVKDDLEKPTDISGVVYIPIDKHEGWKFTLAKEIKSAGYAVDLSRVV